MQDLHADTKSRGACQQTSSVASSSPVDLELAQAVDAAAWELVNMARDINTPAVNVLAAVRRNPAASSASSDAADPKFEEIKVKMGGILERLVAKALESGEFRATLTLSKEMATKPTLAEEDPQAEESPSKPTFGVIEEATSIIEATLAAMKQFSPEAADAEYEMQASEVDMASDCLASDCSCEVLARDKIFDMMGTALTTVMGPGGVNNSQDSVDFVFTDVDDSAPVVQVQIQGSDKRGREPVANGSPAGQTQALSRARSAPPRQDSESQTEGNLGLELNEDLHRSGVSTLSSLQAGSAWSPNQSQALTIATSTSAQEVAELRMQGGLLRERCRALERQIKKSQSEKRL